MENQKKPKVLMIGPDRSVHGGISGVVNNYYEAGLDKKIDLCYIGTMVEGSKFRKLGQAAKAFCLFCIKLPGYDIVHVNMASDSSYYRKSFFIKAARHAGKKIVIHQHGGDFETFYYKEQSGRGRKKIDKVLAMGFIQSEMLVNMQRIVDHCANIALDMVKQAEQDFNVHRFLRKYQEQSRSEYADLLSQYETKYNINQVPHPQEEEEDRSPAEMPEGMVLQS